MLAINQAVDPIYLDKINTVDWLSWPNQRDEHWNGDNDLFRRRELFKGFPVQIEIDQQVELLLPEINRLANTAYTHVGSSWYLCEPGFWCPMHTDGHKNNVMIIYWQTPGPEYGTTFYHSESVDDVRHEFPGTPNTGFFANYRPRIGRPWGDMWHASLRPVPRGRYRLMSMYEFYWR